MINISKNRCVGCGICESKCPVNAITVNRDLGFAIVNKDNSTEYELCIKSCPQNAIKNIKQELIIAFGTDDEKVIKSDDHVGMSKYFQLWKYSKGNMSIVETRENAKYKEDETKTHGDPGKAKATASALDNVDVLAGKMLGPNISRLKKKFVPVIIREPEIEKAVDIIKDNINELIEEKEKQERTGLILS